MGQRAFRGRLTDSLIKRYISTDGQEQTEEIFTKTHIPTKYIDLKFTFDLDDPLNSIDKEYVDLTSGLINISVPRGYGINHLNLIITSKNFGEGKSYLHSNLFILFGPNFGFDIKKITITLFNPITEIYYNDRKLMHNLLEYMCFKKVKLVTINKCLLYYVIPEYSEFSIVLAYNNTNYTQERQLDLKIIEDLFFHPYCQFEASKINFARCLSAIQRTIPEDISNIILPVISFNKCIIEENFSIFEEFAEFLKNLYIKNFKVISFEIKLPNEKNFTLTLNNFVESILKLIPKFVYLFVTFEICNSNNRFEKNGPIKITEIFKKTITQYKLDNVTFAQHISFSEINKDTNLDDQSDIYEYTYYNKCFSNDVYNILNLIKNKMKKISKTNFVKNLILENLYGNEYKQGLFKKGKIDYSTKLVRNRKIVPMKFSNESALIYKN